MIKSRKYGFTLIEALLAAMLIGLAIASLAVSSGAFTMYNYAGVDLSTAEFLVEEIREQTAPVAYAVLGNAAYNPPVDANGDALADFSAYTQNVAVEYVTPSDLTQISVTDQGLRRITVTITKNGTTITSSSWIRANY